MTNRYDKLYGDARTPEQKRIQKESKHWAREVTSDGDGLKVRCPVCGKKGYPGGAWTHAHLEHEECPTCGKKVTKRGLSRHMTSHYRVERVTKYRYPEGYETHRQQPGVHELFYEGKRVALIHRDFYSPNRSAGLWNVFEWQSNLQLTGFYSIRQAVVEYAKERVKRNAPREYIEYHI